IIKADNASGVEALKWMEAEAIAGGLRQEHPQVVALVLSSLEAQQSAEVLGLLPEELRHDAMLRVATLDGIPANALLELNEVIEKQVMTAISRSARSKVGGPQRAAEILNLLSGDLEGSLLEHLKEADPELAAKVEEMMLVFESLMEVEDRGIQTLLREISSETLMLALRGADEMVKEKVLRNMSKRAAEMLRDDLEVMPPVRLSEVDTAQKEILATAKRLAEAGEISLGVKGGDALV
ncbi:MAG: flagellar motor switch protein FliG, partial [Candidatus Competibacteraceae bacterium]|nr:flagellar motor switch protein FliG [Candidatus Competibacteraceae bacterium]